MVQKFRQLFFGMARPVHSIGLAAFVIASAGILSRLLGLLRDHLLAASFGAGDVLDAYYAAFRIPDFVYGLLVAGALSAAFVPVFTETLVGDKKERSWKFVSDFLTALSCVLGLFVLLFFIWSDTLVGVLMPGFPLEKQTMVVVLTRIMLLSPLFFGVSAVFGGVLVSLKQFIVYSLAPLFYNAGIIFGILFLVARFGQNGLAYGVVLGAFLHTIVQWWAVRSDGFRFQWNGLAIFRDRLVQRVAGLMIPRSLSMAVSQISLVIVVFFASQLQSGSLAVFTLAGNLQAVPLGLFGVAFSLAVFPSLSRFAAERAEEEFFRVVVRTTRRILFFVVPMSVLFIVLRAQIVRIVLGAGQFGWDDTIRTFQLLGILAVSLFAQSLVQLFARAFFALQNTLVPLVVALVSETANIFFLFLLLPRWNVYALGFSFVIANVLNVLFLYIFLRKKLRSVWRDGDFFLPAAKIVVASLGAGVAAQAAKMLFGFVPSPLDTFVEIFVQASVTTSVGLATFWLMSVRMRIEEMENLQKFILCRVLGRPESISVEQNLETR